MDIEELRQQSGEALGTLCAEWRGELFRLRSGLAAQEKGATPKQIQERKRGIARILTILREREIGEREAGLKK